MPNYTHSWWPFEPWRHRHARATALVDVMHRLPHGDSVGWYVYDLEHSSSRPRRHSEPVMTPAIQPRHSRRSYDYHRPSRRRNSERREPRFVDQYGYEIGFKHGLTNMLDDLDHDRDPSRFILSFLAMLDPGKGASGSVPGWLIQPSFSCNMPSRITDRDEFDTCVSKLKDQGFVNVTGTRDNPCLAFRHRLTVKDIRDVIVNWLFDTGVGLACFQAITERLTSASPDKKVHHMERLAEVYKSHILRRFAPGDSEFVFADLLIGAAWTAVLELKQPKIAEKLLRVVDSVIYEIDQDPVLSRRAVLEKLTDRRDTLTTVLHSGGERRRREEWVYGRDGSLRISDWADVVDSDIEIGF